jgi:ribosomal protein S18 acetylase RimI-like enzyme
LSFFKNGEKIPDGYSRLLEETGLAIAGLSDEQGRPYTLAAAGVDGSYDLVFLLCDGKPIGVMSFEVKEDDVQLFFCYVGDVYKAYEGQFFSMIVSHFQSAGMSVIRTNFLWPAPERCIEAARNMGFRLIERIEMGRESDRDFPVRQLPPGIEIARWSDEYLDRAARLLSENGNEIDRLIYPQEQTFAGARSQLKKITGNMYGNFLADQSLVARDGSEVIGMLLVTDFPGEPLLIPQVILDRDHRGKGIASAMIGRVIRDTARCGYSKMRLMVNGHNADAIRLYERKGFRTLFVYKQYVLPLRL